MRSKTTRDRYYRSRDQSDFVTAQVCQALLRSSSQKFGHAHHAIDERTEELHPEPGLAKSARDYTIGLSEHVKSAAPRPGVAVPKFSPCWPAYTRKSDRYGTGRPARGGVAFTEDHTGHGPSVGTSFGTGGCSAGRMLNAITCPVGMCCSMWQWKSHVPGLSARNRSTAQLRRQRPITSRCSGLARFCEDLSFASSYGQPQYASYGNLVPGSPARAPLHTVCWAAVFGRKKHSNWAFEHQLSE